MKKSILIFAFALTSSLTFAQETPLTTPAPTEETGSKLAAGIDVVAPYLWRGIKLYSDKVAFQPYASYAATDKLTIGGWMTTNLSSGETAYNEYDWYVSYQITPIVKVMLSDYYVPATKKNAETYEYSRGSYFDYDYGSAQVMDLSLLLDFSEKGVPIDFQWNTLIYGNDYTDVVTDDVTGEVLNKKRTYSSYSEIGYSHSIESVGIGLRAFVGAAVINDNGYYGSHKNGSYGFAFSNVGLNVSKEIKFSDKFSLPVFIRYTFNDDGKKSLSDQSSQQSFISGGMTFKIK